VRQGPPSAADETQRVRRDAVARIAALAADSAVGRTPRCRRSDALADGLIWCARRRDRGARAGPPARWRRWPPRCARRPTSARRRSTS
jgi:hypothetical protein